MLSVIAIMPYVAVLADPSVIHDNVDYVIVFEFFGLEKTSEIILFLSASLFFLLVLSSSFRAYSFYYSARYALMAEAELSHSVLSNYLKKDYMWFLERSKTDLGKTVLSEVSMLIHSGLVPVLRMISQITLMVAMLGALFWVNPILVVFLIVIFFALYAILYWFVKPYLSRIGGARFLANSARFKFASEALSLFREIKLTNTEEHFSAKFHSSAIDYAKAQTLAQILAQTPKYAFELIAFLGVLISFAYLLLVQGSFLEALPSLAVYLFAVYKIIPAIQQIYGSVSQLKFIGVSVESLVFDLTSQDDSVRIREDNCNRLSGSICLDRISFKYPGTQHYVFRDLFLTIEEKSCIGVIGESGSGKSTLIGIITALLDAEEGTVKVGDCSLIDPLIKMRWQSSIGYVSQEVILLDASVAENIAFGVGRSEIDWLAIEACSKAAGIHEFVSNVLPDGYESICGEGGTSLSGGQRQRLGIARALYNKPDILIFDEATSALDSNTESQVLSAISKLKGKVTIVMIGHKNSAMSICDQTLKLKDGRIEI